MPPSPYVRPMIVSDSDILSLVTALVAMQLYKVVLEAVSFWHLEGRTASTRRSHSIALPGKLCILHVIISLTLIFRGRKSAEAISFIVLCQRPVLYGPSATGSIPVDLDHFTAFGSWICQQVVLHTHQKVSKLQMYSELPTEIPKICFEFIEDLAICFRPFQHPDYHRGLR